MAKSIDPTITIHVLDRELKRVLAGVFETTPLGLFVYLGGKTEHYDNEVRRMMEWHLRTLGYEECEYRPLCWTPKGTRWLRKRRWPEDAVWTNGDLMSILDHLESVCD